MTPFTEDGRFDEKTFRGFIGWHIERGSHGLSVTGTTGEPSALSLAEREQVMAVAADEIGGVLFLETNPGPLKRATGRLGLITPAWCLPLCEPSAENQARIEKVLGDYGLLSVKEDLS